MAETIAQARSFDGNAISHGGTVRARMKSLSSYTPHSLIIRIPNTLTLLESQEVSIVSLRIHSLSPYRSYTVNECVIKSKVQRRGRKGQHSARLVLCKRLRNRIRTGSAVLDIRHRPKYTWRWLFIRCAEELFHCISESLFAVFS